jgi:hypothetical protein
MRDADTKAPPVELWPPELVAVDRELRRLTLCRHEPVQRGRDAVAGDVRRFEPLVVHREEAAEAVDADA